MSVASHQGLLASSESSLLKNQNPVCVGCSKKKMCALYGKWTECLYAVDAAAFEAHKKNNKKVTEEKKAREVRPVSDLRSTAGF